MTSEEYRALRETIGSQAKVAAALGLNITTIQRREAAEIVVTNECLLALRCVRYELESVG